MMNDKKHLIIVEDEAIIALDIKLCLEGFGYIVDEVADCTDDAMFYIKKYMPDIVLLDIKLQGEQNGTQIVEEIQNKYKIPVVYLTSHTDPDTLQKAQNTKPYGYVVKPFDEHQLNSTIVIALSRFEEENKLTTKELKTIKINKKYRYSMELKKLYCEDEEISFTKRELAFVYILAKNIDSTVPTDYIIKELWENKEVPHTTLRSLVRRVRDKLEDDIIESYSSIGYKLKSKLEDEKR